MSHSHEADFFEMPPYPNDWTADQRVSAYWHALNFTSFPSTTDGWLTVARAMEREVQRRQRITDREESA